jgi:hypothetical protein
MTINILSITLNYRGKKKSLQKSQKLSEAVGRRTGNGQKKKTKGQTTIHKALHRKLIKKTGLNAMPLSRLLSSI